MDRNLKLLFILHTLNDGARSTFVVLLPFMARDLHLNLTQVGFLGASQGALATALAMPAGFLAAKIGGFRLLSLALLFYSLSAIGVAVSPHLLLLMLTFYIGAVGFGMFHTVGLSLVARGSQKTNAGRRMGDFTSVGDLGRIAIPAGAIFATSIVGWRLAILLVAILGIVLYLTIRFFIPEEKPEKTSRDARTEHHTEWLKNLALLLKHRQVLLVILSAMGDFFASNAITIFLPFLLLAKGVTPVSLGLAMAIFFVGSFVGKVLLGRMIDRLGNVKVFMISEYSMGLIILLLIFSSNLYVLFVLLFILGVFTKGTSPAIQTLVSEITHASHYEKIFAISEFAIGISAAVSPVIAGIFADRFGVTSVFYLAAFMVTLATIPAYFFSRVKVRKVMLEE